MALLWSALALVQPATGLAKDPLVPAPAVCSDATPGVPCFQKPGFIDFSLNGHLFHKGDTVVGTLHYGLPGRGRGDIVTSASTSVNVGDGTLKFLGCKGKRVVVNNTKEDLPTIGVTTCRWRARGGTGGWKLDLAAPLSITGANGSYASGDYYAVISDPAIEGTVRTANDRKENAVLAGVTGAKVKIAGGGFSKTVAVNADGYYFTRVPKPGTYTVTPSVPKKYLGGKPKTKVVTPPSRTVRVGADATAQANFRVDDTLKLTITLDKPSVPADGLQLVKATIAATDADGPAAGLAVDIRPFDGKTFASRYDVPVPAAVCLANGGGRIWPQQTSGAISSVIQTTNPDGKIELLLQVGTIPGKFVLDAWARDSAGLDIKHDIVDVNPQKTVTLTPLSGSTDFTTVLQDYMTKNPSFSLAIGPETIALRLGMLSAAGGLPFNYVAMRTTPGAQGGVYYGTLIVPAGTRLTADATGLLPAGAPGLVLSQDLTSVGRASVYPTFDDAVRGGGLKAVGLAPFAAWLKNDVAGYAMPFISAPVQALITQPYWWMGWGYPGAGPGCA